MDEHIIFYFISTLSNDSFILSKLHFPAGSLEEHIMLRNDLVQCEGSLKISNSKNLIDMIEVLNREA